MPTSTDNVYAIILAAGASTRMGSPKQLLEWHNQTLLTHSIQHAQSILNERIIVVLGAQHASIQQTIHTNDITLVINPDWQEGMASSIREGIQALPDSASAVLIMLCDQPLIEAEHLQHLLTSWLSSPTKIIASQYHHAVGVPALFPVEFFALLQSLQGDKGAKALLHYFEDRLIKIPMPEAELDIDSPEDFERLNKQF